MGQRVNRPASVLVSGSSKEGRLARCPLSVPLLCTGSTGRRDFRGGVALADDPARRRTIAVGGYTSTAVLSGLIGVAGSVWQVGVLRAAAWTARGLRVPARNALLADVAPAGA